VLSERLFYAVMRGGVNLTAKRYKWLFLILASLRVSLARPFPPHFSIIHLLHCLNLLWTLSWSASPPQAMGHDQAGSG
jgi:hypothetical protein